MNDSNKPNDSDAIHPAPEPFHEEWVTAYLDGELSAQQRGEVEARLAYDSNLQQQLLDLQKVRNLVSQLPTWNGNAVDVKGVFARIAELETSNFESADESSTVNESANAAQPPSGSNLVSESLPESLSGANLASSNQSDLNSDAEEFDDDDSIDVDALCDEIESIDESHQSTPSIEATHLDSTSEPPSSNSPASNSPASDPMPAETPAVVDASPEEFEDQPDLRGDSNDAAEIEADSDAIGVSNANEIANDNKVDNDNESEVGEALDNHLDPQLGADATEDADRQLSPAAQVESDSPANEIADDQEDAEFIETTGDVSPADVDADADAKGNLEDQFEPETDTPSGVHVETEPTFEEPALEKTTFEESSAEEPVFQESGANQESGADLESETQLELESEIAAESDLDLEAETVSEDVVRASSTSQSSSAPFPWLRFSAIAASVVAMLGIGYSLWQSDFVQPQFDLASRPNTQMGESAAPQSAATESLSVESLSVESLSSDSSASANSGESSLPDGINENEELPAPLAASDVLPDPPMMSPEMLSSELPPTEQPIAPAAPSTRSLPKQNPPSASNANAPSVGGDLKARSNRSVTNAEPSDRPMPGVNNPGANVPRTNLPRTNLPRTNVPRVKSTAPQLADNAAAEADSLSFGGRQLKADTNNVPPLPASSADLALNSNTLGSQETLEREVNSKPEDNLGRASRMTAPSRARNNAPETPPTTEAEIGDSRTAESGLAATAPQARMEQFGASAAQVQQPRDADVVRLPAGVLVATDGTWTRDQVRAGVVQVATMGRASPKTAEPTDMAIATWEKSTTPQLFAALTGQRLATASGPSSNSEPGSGSGSGSGSGGMGSRAAANQLEPPLKPISWQQLRTVVPNLAAPIITTADDNGLREQAAEGSQRRPLPQSHGSAASSDASRRDRVAGGAQPPIILFTTRSQVEKILGMESSGDPSDGETPALWIEVDSTETRTPEDKIILLLNSSS